MGGKARAGDDSKAQFWNTTYRKRAPLAAGLVRADQRLFNSGYRCGAGGIAITVSIQKSPSVCIPPRVKLVVAGRAVSQASAHHSPRDVRSETPVDGLCHGFLGDPHCHCSSKNEKGKNGFVGP